MPAAYREYLDHCELLRAHYGLRQDDPFIGPSNAFRGLALHDQALREQARRDEARRDQIRRDQAARERAAQGAILPNDEMRHVPFHHRRR